MRVFLLGWPLCRLRLGGFVGSFEHFWARRPPARLAAAHWAEAATGGSTCCHQPAMRKEERKGRWHGDGGLSALLHRSPSLLYRLIRFLDKGGRVWFRSSWRAFAVVVHTLAACDLPQEQGTERSHLGLNLRLGVPGVGIYNSQLVFFSLTLAAPASPQVRGTLWPPFSSFLGSPDLRSWVGESWGDKWRPLLVLKSLKDTDSFIAADHFKWCAAAENNPHGFNTESCQCSVSKFTRASRHIQSITEDKMLDLMI